MQKVRNSAKTTITAKIINNFKKKTYNFPSQYWFTISFSFYLDFEDGAPLKKNSENISPESTY